MNKQEVFNKVAEHLLTQAQRSISLDKFCLYRGPNGLMCAVGCLIPDEVYTADIEGEGVEGMLRILSPHAELLAKHGLTEDNVDLLANLQRLHDKVPVERWSRKLELLALHYDLNYKVEVI